MLDFGHTDFQHQYDATCSSTTQQLNNSTIQIPYYYNLSKCPLAKFVTQTTSGIDLLKLAHENRNGPDLSARININRQGRPKATHKPKYLCIELTSEDARLQSIICFMLSELGRSWLEGLCSLPKACSTVPAIVILMYGLVWGCMV